MKVYFVKSESATCYFLKYERHTVILQKPMKVTLHNLH
jgi:hypothetical protein